MPDVLIGMEPLPTPQENGVLGAGAQRISPTPSLLWIKVFFDSIWKDRIAYLAIMAYIAMACALAIGARQTDKLVVWIYVSTWSITTLSILVIFVVVMSGLATLRGECSHPLETFISETKNRILHITPNFILYLGLSLFTGAYTSIKNILPQIVTYSYDKYLADIDRILFFGEDPWRLLQPLLDDPMVNWILALDYEVAWGMLATLFPAFVVIFCSDRVLRAQYIASWLIIWSVLGNLVAGLIMSAGPPFYAFLTGDALRFGPLLNSLATNDNDRLSPVLFQHYLWRLYTSGQAGFGSGISAFPSMHVASITLCWLAVFALNRRAGYLMSPIPLLIYVGSVHLGWHYAVDGLFSIAAVAFIWWAVGRLLTSSSSPSRVSV
jgi:hypothetical protein